MSLMDYTIGLVFFDVDSALVRGVSSSRYLAQKLGNRKQMLEAEAALEREEIDKAEFYRIDAAAWKRHKPEEVRAWLDDMPLMDGIEEVTDWCRRHGLAPYVSSLAWNFVGNYLAERFGFEGCCGPELEERAGMFSGRVAHLFDADDKLVYAQGLCEKLYIEPRACAAVGDGRSDLPLFGFVGCPIAFNASNVVKAQARFSARSTDLRDILPYLQEWEREL
ncbi:MAG: HAD family phosphatase [Coriobacteriia bacterium]|nr:HAD family phosphatase [Coriobacteriia bacterium]MBS5477989.1 HAD family phosphatase [Coriobacteriia bacterium]